MSEGQPSVTVNVESEYHLAAAEELKAKAAMWFAIAGLLNSLNQVVVKAVIKAME